MTVNEILTPLINQEFQKHESQGTKIRLRTVKKRRIKYSVICAILALCSIVEPPLFLIIVAVYVLLMLKTRNNVNVIISLAKKSPDKQIDQIIAEELAP